MPRDGAGIYSRPPGTDAVADTTIDSAKYNNNVADVEGDLNLPRPIVAGGTAATSADAALTSLSAEKAKQVVSNWDSTVWRAGSFYAATSAAGVAPVAGHAFAGIAYYANASDFVNEAVDLTDPANPVKYVRVMAAGVWSAWKAIGVGAVRYDLAQTLTAAQKTQARANIDALKKNYILNGAMQVSQENGTTAGTANPYYPADQFYLVYSNTGTQTAAQVISPTPGGSSFRLRVTATVADASVATSDYSLIRQKIEGYRTADLKLALPTAKTITLQFGVKAPAGTYGVGLRNVLGDRCYAAEYVIAAGEANTDVIKSVVVALDTTGAWNADSNVGLEVTWWLMAGSSVVSSLNSWSAAGFATPNQFNFMGTNGNVFELFDVGLYEGTVAPAFQVPDYASELALCQRYFEIDAPLVQSPAASSIAVPYSFKEIKRSQPTIVFSGVGYSNAAGLTASNPTTKSFGQQFSASAAGGYVSFTFTANARL